MRIEYLMVFIGGSFGAVCRYALSMLIKRLISIEFPVSTFIINLSGSFLMGILLSAHPGNFNQLLLGTGFMGGFTTFSTFQLENITLFQEKNYKMIGIYVCTSFFFCISFAIFGFKIGDLIEYFLLYSLQDMQI